VQPLGRPFLALLTTRSGVRIPPPEPIPKLKQVTLNRGRISAANSPRPRVCLGASTPAGQDVGCCRSPPTSSDKTYPTLVRASALDGVALPLTRLHPRNGHHIPHLLSHSRNLFGTGHPAIRDEGTTGHHPEIQRAKAVGLGPLRRFS